ncbi:ABC transporter permease subunit [Micromonospora cathayae]|uniref:ABC transporter permease subunit n=1 Tax=Micromonospora cathayae TaxID=3028804 RepID=A0ABY7ZNB1_9ACTN|nr:ABC transporter permease subunit [Micromonospora sp. HUAS 3]WDZ84390.1 ABC transporter permease subunit [Micromonospora sp. HUAS 3]
MTSIAARPGFSWARLGLRIAPWLSVLAVVGLWIGTTATGSVSDQFLPSPTEVVGSAAELVEVGLLWSSIGVTITRGLLGATIGITAGILLGVLAGFARWAEFVLDKPVQIIRAVPFTAMLPLLILWVGIGEQTKVLLVALATAVPVYFNTFGGIRNVDRKLVEAGRVYGLTAYQLATRVLLRGSLPSVFIGIRYALGITWAVLVLAESLNAVTGIGFLLTNARQYGQGDVVILCVVLYAVLGLVTDALVALLERRLFRWRQAHRGV